MRRAFFAPCWNFLFSFSSTTIFFSFQHFLLIYILQFPPFWSTFSHAIVLVSVAFSFCFSLPHFLYDPDYQFLFYILGYITTVQKENIKNLSSANPMRERFRRSNQLQREKCIGLRFKNCKSLERENADTRRWFLSWSVKGRKEQKHWLTFAAKSGQERGMRSTSLGEQSA